MAEKAEHAIKTKENVKKERGKMENDVLEEYKLDFTTSSAISKMNIKFLILYMLIFWISAIPVILFAHEWFRDKTPITQDIGPWISTILLFPWAIFCMIYIFYLSCAVISKLFLIIINLIHRPKEGVFKAEEGNKDYEFWRLRIELKKLVLWMARNLPLPQADALAFRLFGVKIDFSSHMFDAWVDPEFIEMGRKVMVGQGSVVMSSMIVGKYLIIKRVYFDDYVVVGGQAHIAPGTFIGKDTIIGAVSSTNYNQLLEPGYIYFGIPAIQLKENKYAEERRDIIVKKDVDEGTKYVVKHDVNIDEDKKHMVQKDEEQLMKEEG